MKILKLAIGCLILASFFAKTNLGDDLQIYYTSGDVIVNGDVDSNSLKIRRLSGSVHMFEGLDGTTINGRRDPLLLPILDDLKIRMKGGDDFLDIYNVYLRGTSHADLVIQMGEGDDEVEIEYGSVRRNISIVDGGSIQDSELVDVKYVNANSINVETLGVSDIAILYNNVSWMAIDSGLEGADRLTVIGNDSNLIDVFASDESDRLVFMGNDVSHGFLDIRLKGDNDFAQLSVNDFGVTNASIDGGSGIDTGTGIQQYNAWWWGNVRVTNFEF